MGTVATKFLNRGAPAGRVADILLHPAFSALLQGDGDYLCVKVLRHSKSKKTMVRTESA